VLRHPERDDRQQGQGVAILDKSDLLLGIDHIFKEVDFGRVKNANAYYKRVLRRSAAPSPAFVKSVNTDKLKKLAGKVAKGLKPAERDYVTLSRLGTITAPLTRAEALSIVRGLVRTYPNDLGLTLTCAKMLIHRELYADAVMLLHRATQMDPKCDYAWAHIALISALAQDHGRAAFCARKALELGNNLVNSMQKAYVFTLLIQGLPAKVGPFETAPHFRIASGELTADPSLLPAVTYVTEPETLPKQPVILFACDSGYFRKFGRNLLLSLVDVADSFSLHVHLVCPEDGDIAWLKTYRDRHNKALIISQETPPRPELARLSTYLASCRFLHAPAFLRKYQRDYLILDADSILNSDAALRRFTAIAKAPVLYYAERGPVWDTVSAPFTFLPYGPASLKFIDHCQTYLAHMFFREKPSIFWYMDQMALLGAYLENTGTVHLCPARLVSDVRCGEDAIFWTLSNDKKDTRYGERCASLAHLNFAAD
jgi:tetratricopeptide (TPR) repeat protein